MRLHSQCALLGAAGALVACLTSCTQRTANAYQGYVEGKFVYVASPQAGRLDRLSVTRGEIITARQPLFMLEPEPELSAELQARELLRTDENPLTDLETGTRPPEKDVIKAQLSQANLENQKSVDILKTYEQHNPT